MIMIIVVLIFPSRQRLVRRWMMSKWKRGKGRRKEARQKGRGRSKKREKSQQAVIGRQLLVGKARLGFGLGWKVEGEL